MPADFSIELACRAPGDVIRQAEMFRELGVKANQIFVSHDVSNGWRRRGRARERGFLASGGGILIRIPQGLHDAVMSLSLAVFAQPTATIAHTMQFLMATGIDGVCG
jgi:hypothetical protein